MEYDTKSFKDRNVYCVIFWVKAPTSGPEKIVITRSTKTCT